MEFALSKRASVGRWWFRNRSASPLPILVLILFVRPDFDMHASIFVLGLACLIAAESLRIWAVGVAGSGTRTRGDDVNKLVLIGPYQISRNPLYIANILLYTSVGLLFGHIFLTIVSLGYFIIQYVLIVAYEEDLLTKKFGAEYSSYCKKVPRWLIGPRQELIFINQTIDIRKAIRSERSTLYAIALVSLLWMTRFIWRG